MRIGKDSLPQMLYVVSVTDKASAIASVSMTTSCSLPERLTGVNATYETDTLQDKEFPHPVRIKWSRHLDTIFLWNEVCADIMELFGLPGNRYITDVNINDMTVYFRDERDAVIMALKFSEHVQ